MSALKAFVKSITPAPIWNKLRVMRIQNSITSFENKVVKHNYCGHDLTVHLEDRLAGGWYDKDWDKLHEVEFLKEKGIIKEGAKIFDLGAHQSVVATILSKEVGESGNVLALEANSHNFKVGNKNKNANNAHQLEILNMAISDKKGTVIFNEGLNGSVTDENSEWGKVEVACISVDELADEKFSPDLVYLDVEGFEYIVMKGAKKVLDSNCSWFIEMHGQELIGNFGGTVEAVMENFPESKYELFMAEDGKPFTNYDESNPLINERFFLIAIKKS